MRYLWWVWLAALLSGCIPYSDNPLTAPAPEGPDPAILGTWFVHEEGETVFLHLGIDEKTKGLRVVMVEFREDGKVKTSEFTGHTSRLGNTTCMDLRWDRPTGNEEGYLFVRYQVAGDRMGLALMRSDAVEKAIRDGSIRGRIEQNPSSIRLTDSSEHLQEYVRRHAAALFEELKWMRRWKPCHQGQDGAAIGKDGDGSTIQLRREDLQMKRHGVQAKDRLPFDCQAWFSVSGL